VYSEDYAANHWQFKEDCVGCATPAEKPSTIDAMRSSHLRRFVTRLAEPLVRALPRASEPAIDGPVHGAGAGSVQGVLAGLTSPV
jgi:hypothetical protein